MREVDLSAVRPYADHLDDGLVQLSFTLPVPYSLAARRAALELAGAMGFEEPEVVHFEELTKGYTYFVMYGRCAASVDFASLRGEGFDVEYMSEDEIERFARERVGRRIVVVGASTGSDTHSVGIDAMLNLKGYHGHHGLEGYGCFETYNLGSQVPNGVLLAKAMEVGADAILVSQTVTQQSLHVHNLTELVEMVEAEGRRSQMILACGGPRVTAELAKELGYDAGFSKGTEPQHLATFLVRELAARAEPAPARAESAPARAESAPARADLGAGADAGADAGANSAADSARARSARC